MHRYYEQTVCTLEYLSGTARYGRKRVALTFTL